MPVLVLANEATAGRRRVYFHCVDATDGITPETGEAGGQPQVSTNGGAFTNTGIGTLTHLGNGRYYADLTQALVATAGDSIETRYKSANTAETPGDSVRVVAFDPYDAVRLGLTALPNAAAEASGGLVTRGTGTGQISVSSGAVIVQSGTGTGQISLTSGVAAVNVTQWLGQAAVAVSVNGVPKVDVAYINGGVATQAGTVDANVTQVDGQTANATATVEFDRLDAAVSSRSTYAGGDTAGTTTLLSRLSATRAGYLDNLTNLDAAVTTRLATAGYTTPPTAAAIADAVWDETLADHLTGGSTGAGLNAAGSAGDPWSTALPGAYSSGTAGNILGNRLDAAVSGRSSHSAADVWAVGTRTITGGTVSTVSDKTGYSLASTGLDAVVVEGSTTIIASARGWNSALLGKASGLGTTTAVYRDLADSKNRISATVDSDGNRTAVTRDLT